MLIRVKYQGWLFVGLMLMSLLATGSQSLLEKAEQGDRQAMLEAGVALLEGQITAAPGKAEALLHPLAESGNTQARLWLGRAYRDGLGGMEKNTQKSFTCFEQAAGREGMNPEAQLELGKAYMRGIGTDRNLIAAYMWTSLSADQEGGWTRKAVQQRNELQKQLTPAQLEKAQELVQQLRSIYLVKP